MKILRFVVMLAVVGYAGWLAWPFIEPLTQGGGDLMAAGAETAARAGGDLFGIIPPWTLWAGAVVLYLIAALMLGSGNSKAAVAYFLGFIADAVLRLAIGQTGEAGVAARSGPATMSAEAAGGLPVEPVWLVLGGLVILGVLVVLASRRIRRQRVAGQFAY